MKHAVLFLFAAVLAALVALVGCGGSSSGSGAATGKVAVYATDSLGNNDHVWVKIFKITVENSAASQTIFDDTAGKVVDLASLRDASGGKFAFLSYSNCSGGPFRTSTVTMSKDLTIVPKGATNGLAKQFADQFDATGGLSKVTFGFKNPRNLGQGDPELIVDFDLQKWNEVGGKIVPVLTESEGGGLDDKNRHNDDDHGGIISALTGVAPDQQFTLTTGGGKSFIVRTDLNTVIFRSGDKPNAVLANGLRVEVRGVFMVAEGFFRAKSIKIEDGTGDHHPHAKGAPLAIDATAGTFDVKITGCEGFIPRGSIVHVTTSTNTVFRTHRGVTMTKDEFFTALATANSVEVEGILDETNNTIAASRSKIEDEGQGGGGGHEAEAKGATSKLDSVAGTFSLTLSEWEGFAGGVGNVVSVTTSGSTVYKDKQGNVVTKDVFFAALDQFGHAEVKGSFLNGVISAQRCKIEDH